MKEENYLLKETLTENVVRLYAVEGGAVAIGASAHRMEKLTGGKYRAVHRRLPEIDAPAVYIPTEELLKNYASQLVAGDEPGVYTVAGEAFDSAQAPAVDSAQAPAAGLVAERSRSLAEEPVKRAPAAKGANYPEVHEIAYQQETPVKPGDAPILEPYIIRR
jgi:hypothetical protein